MTRSRKSMALVCACVAAAVLYHWPILSDWHNLGVLDWDQHLFMQEVPRQTIVRHHQFPLWNPYACGGMPMLANPQSRFLSPTFVLHLLFGVLAAERIEMILHLAVGLVGAFLLARRVGLGAMGATTAAAIMLLNGTYAGTLAAGMTTFMTIAYIPWMFLFALKSLDDARYVWAVAAMSALTFLEGGPYTITLLAPFLAFYFGLESLRQRSLMPLWRVGLAGVLSIGLAAIKILPSVEFLRQYPKVENDYSGYSLWGLANMLFNPNTDLHLPDTRGFLQGYSWSHDENLMYVGLLAGILFVVGIVSSGRRHHLLALSWVLFLWLSFGTRAEPLSLWEWLHKVPFYTAMHVAQRFRIIMMLCFALFAGFGFEFVLRKVKPRWVVPVGLALISMVTIDLIRVNAGIYHQAFTVPPVAIEPVEQFSQRLTPAAGNARLSPEFTAVQMGVGVVNCYEPLTAIPENAIPEESDKYRGETYLDNTAGSARFSSWSPNRFTIAVAAESRGDVVVNQNCYPGWFARADGVSVPIDCQQHNGLLAAPVNNSVHEVEFVYRPTSFVVGAVMSAIFAAIAVMALRSPRRRAPNRG